MKFRNTLCKIVEHDKESVMHVECKDIVIYIKYALIRISKGYCCM